VSSVRVRAGSVLSKAARDVLGACVLSAVGLALALPGLNAQGFTTIWYGALLIGVLTVLPKSRWGGLPAGWFCGDLHGGPPCRMDAK